MRGQKREETVAVTSSVHNVQPIRWIGIATHMFALLIFVLVFFVVVRRRSDSRFFCFRATACVYSCDPSGWTKKKKRIKKRWTNGKWYVPRICEWCRNWHELLVLAAEQMSMPEYHIHHQNVSAVVVFDSLILFVVRYIGSISKNRIFPFCPCVKDFLKRESFYVFAHSLFSTNENKNKITKLSVVSEYFVYTWYAL